MTNQLLEISFISLIIIVTIYFHIKFDRFAVLHGPEILTTLGILGCFTGITIALFNFNPNDIGQSVPNLLAGIRTAFWASLAGVVGSLTLRFGQKFRAIKSNSDSISTQTSSLSDVVSTVDSFKSSIIGNHENSLISQIRINSKQANEKSDELISEFKFFAENMVKNNQKAIILALEEVIKDFNSKLSEQFGDNFKQLNIGIGKLLEWQDEYKKHLEFSNQEQKKIILSLELASQHLNKIVESASSFNNVAKELGSQIEFLNLSREILISQQTSLSIALKNMKDVTPSFEKKTSRMLDEIEQGMNEIESRIIKISDKFGDELIYSHKEMKNLLFSTLASNEDELKKIQVSMSKVTDNLGLQMQISSNDLKQQMSDILIENQEILKHSLLDNVSIIKEGVVNLDQALQKELNDSLEMLGRQLASLSNKFVDDYTPLTEKLQKVVEISKKI